MNATLKTQEIVHASCVSVGQSAALLTGASGAGKSALALELICRGAVLVADDRTVLTAGEYGVAASCPDAIVGQIEARGVGVLAVQAAANAIVRIVVNMDKTETDRLPPFRETDLLGHRVQLLLRADFAHFPTALILLLNGARSA